MIPLFFPSPHIQIVTNSCPLFIQNISQVSQLLSTSITLVQGTIIAQLDQCNGLITDLLAPLQSIPQTVARVIFLKDKADQITLHKTLQWLHNSLRIKSELLILAYITQKDLISADLSNFLAHPSSRLPLKSSLIGLLSLL